MDRRSIVLPIIALVAFLHGAQAVCGTLGCSHGCIQHEGKSVCACPAGWEFKKLNSQICVKNAATAVGRARHYHSCNKLSDFDFKLLNDDGTWRPFSAKDDGSCASASGTKIALEKCAPSSALQRWVYNTALGQLKNEGTNLCVTSTKTSKYSKAYLSKCRTKLFSLQNWSYNQNSAQLYLTKTTKCMAHTATDNSLRVVSGCRHTTYGRMFTPGMSNAKTDKLNIGAFNVRVFGAKKLSDPDVEAVLLKILSRYDMCLVMEIRDTTELAFPSLVTRLRQYSGQDYDYIVGPRKGRSNSKEQYGFVYRVDRMSVSDSWQYPDLANKFERPPFLVQFMFKQPASQRGQKITFIPSHTKPDEAIEEMNALVDVYDAWLAKGGDKNAVILGDLNADCSYVCKSCWSKVKLATQNDKRFTWLIDSGVDTTAGRTHCAYDRIILAGDWLPRHCGKHCKASVFNFHEKYGLSDKLALAVSDHYPVELSFS